MEPVKLHCVSSEDDLLEVKTFVSLGCPNLQLKLYTSRTHPWINFNQVSAKKLKKLIDEFIITGELTEASRPAPSTIGKGYAF